MTATFHLRPFIAAICMILVFQRAPQLAHAANITAPFSSDGTMSGGPSSIGSGIQAVPVPSPAEAPATKSPGEGAAPIILSVGDLADLCASRPSDNDGVASRNICLGFTLGVIAVAERQQASGGAKLFCTPKPTFDLGETMNSFVQLAQAKKAVRSAPVVDGLAQFLQLRFPCK